VAADGSYVPCCMTWNVVLSNRAERALARLMVRDRQRITRAFSTWSRSPCPETLFHSKGHTPGRIDVALALGALFSR